MTAGWSTEAGIAWAHLDQTDNVIVNIPVIGVSTPLFTGTGGTDRVGWTVGTGIEWAIWNNWSITAEYDYIDFGTKTNTVNGVILPAVGGGLAASFGLQDTLHVQQAKFGINWHIMPNIW